MPPPSSPFRASRRREIPFDLRLLGVTLLAGGPATLVAMTLLWAGDFTPKVQWTLTLVVVGFWLGGSLVVRERIVRPLQTLSNLLAALREGDFSIRARGACRGDSLGDVHAEVNTLGSILKEQRLVSMEATALLRTVMAEIDVAIFAFDENGQLRLINRAGQELIAQPAERVLGRNAADLGLAECLTGDPARLLTISFPGGQGRWGMRRTVFRERGLPHELIVIADLSRPLRDEELKAWQRLVRVLGHELNNSLAPIKSLAGSLATLLRRSPRAPDWEEDMTRGLEIIATRADGLSRFMEAYARLARLPPPKLATADVGAIARRVVGLETRLTVVVEEGPPARALVDAAQIEQLLINMVKNAVEAALETGGAVRLRWTNSPQWLEMMVEDEGPGIANTANLFVPFFTTKPTGSGIGLVLCRQIAENHGGSFMLANRIDRTGCIATLRLPLRDEAGVVSPSAAEVAIT
jgi:two-component system nitrogen regulation sensor histidine kinase NtrY